MQIFSNSKYNFVGARGYAVAFSILWILIGLGLYMKNGINWGIDFAGGASITLKFKDQVPAVRQSAGQLGAHPPSAAAA
jgi:preprotein translocase subunit SecF